MDNNYYSNQRIFTATHAVNTPNIPQEKIGSINPKKTTIQNLKGAGRL